MPYARVSLARASRPAQKQHSPPLSAPARTASRRTHAEPIRTIYRAAQRRERYPGARPRLQATTAVRQGSAQANMSGTLSSSPAEEADAECLPAARMADGTGRATRLTRSRPCGCHCYSTLVRRKSIRYEGLAASCVQLHRRMLRCTHMGSCESVVGAIAEAETAA